MSNINNEEYELNYAPNNLIDTVIEKLQLKNDAALARVLGVAPPVISKLRGEKLRVGPSILISMHECTNLSIKELRELMGDRRIFFSPIPKASSVSARGNPNRVSR